MQVDVEIIVGGRWYFILFSKKSQIDKML